MNKEQPGLDALLVEAKKLVRILEEPREVGLFTWWQALHRILEEISKYKSRD